MPASRPLVSIVIPTFNEAGNISEIITRIDCAMGSIPWEAIFVDDDSPDGTVRIARKIAQSDTRVRCLRRVRRRGLAGACIEGVLSSSAPYVVIMDADLQHDERILPALLTPLQSGTADLVIGSREDPPPGGEAGFSHVRGQASKFATRLAMLVLSVTARDPMSGFFAMRRDAFEAIAPKLATEGFKLLLDILATRPGGLRIVEVPYSFKSRRHGESKFDLRAMADFAALVLHKACGGHAPLRFFLFAIVGGSGLLIHLITLRLGLAVGLHFEASQSVAVAVAMVSNFGVNNAITYRDLRLRGTCAAIGLAKFCLVCSVGALANIGVAGWLFGQDQPWWLAGLSGALMGAIFNFAMSSAFVWRTPKPAAVKAESATVQDQVHAG